MGPWRGSCTRTAALPGPETLEELTGPTTGVVELPLRLDWSEQGRYDLADPKQLALMYEVVIREAMHVEDLRDYLDGPTLRRVDALRAVRRFPATAFEPYGLTDGQVEALCRRLLGWADEIAG